MKRLITLRQLREKAADESVDVDNILVDADSVALLEVNEFSLIEDFDQDDDAGDEQAEDFDDEE